jgi:uncharacterized protein YceK
MSEDIRHSFRALNRRLTGIPLVVMVSLSISGCSAVHTVTDTSYVGSANVSNASNNFSNLDQEIGVFCAQSVTQRCREDLESQIRLARSLRGLSTNDLPQSVLSDVVQVKRDVLGLIRADQAVERSSSHSLQNNLSNQQTQNLDDDLSTLESDSMPSVTSLLLWVFGIVGVLAVIAAPAFVRRISGPEAALATTSARIEPDKSKISNDKSESGTPTQEELIAGALQALTGTLGEVNRYLKDRRRDRLTLLIQAAGVLVALYAVFRGVH